MIDARNELGSSIPDEDVLDFSEMTKGVVVGNSKDGLNAEIYREFQPPEASFGQKILSPVSIPPYEFIWKAWTLQPERFTFNPLQQMPGLNI